MGFVGIFIAEDIILNISLHFFSLNELSSRFPAGVLGCRLRQTSIIPITNPPWFQVLHQNSSANKIFLNCLFVQP